MDQIVDWDDVRLFLAVARARKIHAAARLLTIDPTTVTRRLSRLEQRLGARLFDVHPGGRVLSEQGTALLRHAERVESAILSAVEDIAGQGHMLTGHVRLSVAEGFGTWVLAPALADFNARYPGVRLDLVTASGFLNPSKREADMAVMLARPPRGRSSVQRLGDYRLHLYAAPAYLDHAGVPAQTADLGRHILVGYVPDFIFSPELDYLNEVHAGLEAHLRATSINMQHGMIAQGAGIGVLPDFMAKDDPRLVQLLPEAVEIRRSFWLVIHEDLRTSPRVDAVATWLRERVNGIRAG
jgi:DNA-binding transcriptional LysR family regulator